MAAGSRSTIEGLPPTQCTSEEVCTHIEGYAIEPGMPALPWHICIGICCVAGDPIARKKLQRCCSVWQLSHAMNLWQLLPAQPCWTYLVYLTAKTPSSPQHAHLSHTVHDSSHASSAARSIVANPWTVNQDDHNKKHAVLRFSPGADWEIGVCAESALYGSSPSVRVTEWAPGANDILDALTQLGYKPAQTSANGRQTKKNAAKPDSLPAPEDNSSQPQLLNVVLLLRLLKAVCQAKVQPRAIYRYLLLATWCKESGLSVHPIPI